MSHRPVFRRLAMLLVAAATSAATATSATAAISGSGPDAELAILRSLAQALRKAGPGKDTSVVLEYRLGRHAGPCLNGTGTEQLLRLRGDGSLSLLRTRSHAESEIAGPARFSGRLSKAEWDSLFASLSRMKWADGGPTMPMPGMAETNRAIRLKRGKQEAGFDVTGHLPPAQATVAAGLDAASDAMRRAMADTLWALVLTGAKAERKDGVLKVKGIWRLEGRSTLRLRLPAAGNDPGACGSANLRWTLLEPEEPGVTSLPSELQDASLASLPPRAGSWVDLRPGDTASVILAYAVPKSAEAERKKTKGSSLEAQLILAGATVVDIGSAGGRQSVGGQSAGAQDAGHPDTLTVTLHSPWFPF